MSCMRVYTWPEKLIVIGTVLQLYMHETWCKKKKSLLDDDDDDVCI